MYILVYSHAEDPVVAALSGRSELEGEPLTRVSVTELLEDAVIRDEIAAGKASLSWSFSDGRRVTNAPGAKLINRVHGVESGLFSGFHPEDKEYAQAEFQAYLAFALEAFSERLFSPGAYGLGGGQTPLPYQWETARRLCPEVAVPDYFVGPKRLFKEGAPSLGRWIVSEDLHAYYDWAPSSDVAGRLAAVEGTGLLFARRRPSGEPVLVSLLGERALAMTLDAQRRPLDAERFRLPTSKLAKALDLPFCEALYFVDGARLTFAMISPRLAALRGFPGFEDAVQAAIPGHFKEAVHA